ncbi:hypothetical protein [Micromonospora sp. WMMC273]|uniref:hypothetical protein n=1 Tax=Micromonospora sp. WMMC273 TaxID=3015157 RepID=UPI0022B601D6|nr:hypothetical protein [Micromonospora sp. WMMC273]MCZ7478814.1 hypothetical protein [Micromonospora sp. WMMC273]MCZ7478942.1 hypothetical protein [Micromonospora sp. WMMC273]
MTRLLAWASGRWAVHLAVWTSCWMLLNWLAADAPARRAPGPPTTGPIAEFDLLMWCSAPGKVRIHVRNTGWTSVFYLESPTLGVEIAGWTDPMPHRFPPRSMSSPPNEIRLTMPRRGPDDVWILTVDGHRYVQRTGYPMECLAPI